MITLITLVSVAILYFIFRESLKMKREALTPQVPLGQADLEAFSNLLNEGELEFMRTHLPPADFEKFERNRDRVLLEYVNGLAAFTASRIRSLTAPGVVSDQSQVQLLLETRQVALRTGILLRASLWTPGFLHLARRGRAGCQNLARSCNSVFATEAQLAGAAQR